MECIRTRDRRRLPSVVCVSGRCAYMCSAFVNKKNYPVPAKNATGIIISQAFIFMLQRGKKLTIYGHYCIYLAVQKIN
jgi:hypothetical protein